jgi:hypothetical protein
VRCNHNSGGNHTLDNIVDNVADMLRGGDDNGGNCRRGIRNRRTAIGLVATAAARDIRDFVAQTGGLFVGG